MMQHMYGIGRADGAAVEIQKVDGGYNVSSPGLETLYATVETALFGAVTLHGATVVVTYTGGVTRGNLTTAGKKVAEFLNFGDDD